MITDPRRFFAAPATPRQRQYEALRAFFVEGLSSARPPDASDTRPVPFACSATSSARGAAGLLRHAAPGPANSPRRAPPRSRSSPCASATIRSTRSVRRSRKGTPLSPTAVREVLARRLRPLAAPARRGATRPRRPHRRGGRQRPPVHPRAARVHTRVGGLFLFIPDLVRLDAAALRSPPCRARA